MGNKILGKRSRSFYKGFNQRQIDYIKEKFSIMSKNNILDQKLFMNEYMLNKTIVQKFYEFVDFDSNGQIQQYQFICAVHSFCNMTVAQLGQTFFDMIASKIKGDKQVLSQQELYSFTQICLKYNYNLQNKTIQKKQIEKVNKNKFKKYDFDKSKSISKDQFIKICTKDQDYKKWLYNMGFITKNQLEFNDQIYDLIDSDIEGQIQKHLTLTNPNIDKIKRGIQHRINDDQFQLVETEGQQSLPPGKNQILEKRTNQKKPWETFVTQCKIDQQLKKKENPNSPTQSLTMHYVFGYRSYDCRNNLKFDQHGNIIYHQGSVGIILNDRENNQRYMNQHKDDITCLDVIDDLVVTGQLGSQPSVILWKSKGKGNIKSDLIITKNLKQSVGNVVFSKNKKLLAVSCNDADHKIIIYNIENLQTFKNNPNTQIQIKSSGSISKNAIIDLKFSADSKTLVAATIKQMLFITFQNSELNTVRGQFNDFSNSSALCLLSLQTKYKDKPKKWVLSGMTNGSIYFWQQDKCVKAVSGHSGSVSALALLKLKQNYNSFVSGDKTGKIIVWNQNMDVLSKCFIPKTNSPSNMIISISVSNNNDILVSTKSSNVYKAKIGKQLILKDENVIISGHSQGKLWALAVDQQPKSNIFYTGGQDYRLIKWSYGDNNKLIEQKKCSYKIRSLSHNQIKKMLAVGYINGVIQIFNQKLITTNIKYDKIKNPDQQVLNLIKFNKEGSLIAACYSYNKKFQIKIIKFDGKELKQDKTIILDSKVTSLDFQTNSKYIRLNTEDSKFILYDIQKNPIQIKDSKQYNKRQIYKAIWQTHTTILSPQTRGFKTEGVSQSDITCCQRSRSYRNVILIGDKYSKIKLFNFFCINYPLFNKYQGHSNQVTAIQFNRDQKFVISIGGQQKSIIVWKYDPDQDKNKQFFQTLKVQAPIQEQEFVKAKGQEVQATSQYKGQIKQPSYFKNKCNPKKDNRLPSASLSIGHVFGIRNQYLKDQVRNMCKFSKTYDHILFPTACLGVKMHIETKEQNFYLQHKEDIVSFAVDSSRTLMATGQMAEKNTKDPKKKIVSIIVWDIQKQKVLKKLEGFHTIAVVLLQFSPSGKLLFSCGNDSKNSYAVYDWKSGSILYSGPISGGKVNGICWKSETQFMTCGMDHVKFWENGKGKQGKFSHGKMQSIFSCAYSKTQNMYITGSLNGRIHTWKENSTTGVRQGHKGKVQSIIIKNDKIYTGADDGIIKIWKKSKNGQIEEVQTFFDARRVQKFKKMKYIQQQQFGILSIDMSDNMETLIVTKGASVVYLKNNKVENAKIIHQGHYKGQLWGLTSQIDQNFVITGGDDKTVRLWDLKKKQEVNRVYFTNKIRALDWQNSSIRKIVVADSRAQLYLYNKDLTNLEDQYQGRPFTQNQKSQIQPWIEDIKFSPDSSALAYGTHAKSQYLQIVAVDKNKFVKGKKKQFKGGSSAVNHIDWSKDSSSIAINTQAWQYLFYNKSGIAQSASSMKNIQWATYTRKYGFQSQGIFQDIDHSNINTICLSPDSSFLAVGYDDQTIRLFNYPCYIPHQVFKTYYGHSSHVTKIKFNQDKMFSIGGLDRTLIIWDVQGSSTNKKISQDSNQSDDGLSDLEEDVDLPGKILRKKKKEQKIQEFYEVQNEGDQFMAVKPWLGAIRQPSYKYPKADLSEPNVKINLQYVFGYRTKDCRQNLFYKNDRLIIYHAAAVLIYHDIQSNTQTLHTQHNDDILSIDYHKETDTVLTGELGPKPLVCLYKKGIFQESFKAPVPKGVISVSISPNGQLGACVGIDEDHTIAILDLTKRIVLQRIKGPKKIVTKIKWKNNQQFITIGINHYKQWKFDIKAKKTSKLSESSQKANYVSLDVYDDNLILVGASQDNVYNFSQNKRPKPLSLSIRTKNQKTQKNSQDQQQQFIKVGVVQCVKITQKFVACGTRNGFIIFLNKKDLAIIKTLNMESQFDELDKADRPENYCIRSLDFIGNKMLFGTFGSQIYQVEFDKQFNLKKKSFKNILKCHYSPNNLWTNEVWGLCISENNDYAFSCSDDSTIRCWNLNEKRLVYCKNINQNKDDKDLKNKQYPDDIKLRSIALSPENKYIIAGAKDGTVRIFRFDPEEDIKISQEVHKFKHAQQWISDIKFGFKSLIIGSHDNGIYVYDFDQQGEQLIVKKKYRPMKKHSSYITHLDVSRDSCFLQSTCGAYQLLFWDINSGKQLTGGATMLKDQKWKTWTCNIGWPVQGIYPKCTDGTFINSVDRSNSTINGSTQYQNQEDFYLLAAGNDNGKVCIYNYPSLIKNSKFKEGKGHSSHVTTVRWNKSDEKLVSVGGQDQCVMIWNVQKSQKAKTNYRKKK